MTKSKAPLDSELECNTCTASMFPLGFMIQHNCSCSLNEGVSSVSEKIALDIYRNKT